MKPISALIILLLFLTACKKDKKEPNILATWEITHIKQFNTMGYFIKEVRPEYKDYVQFLNGNKFHHVVFNPENEVEDKSNDGVYSLSNKILKFPSAENLFDQNNLPLEFISEDIMVLNAMEPDGSRGEIYLKKISKDLQKYAILK